MLRTRQHLAAVRPNGNGLVLELLRFEHELVDAKTLDLPASKEKASDAEMKSAAMLIDAMTKRFDPGEFRDTYVEELRAMLEARARGKGPHKVAAAKAPRATNVSSIPSAS